MSSDSPSASVLETFQKTTETVAEFIRWLAELIQRRNWFMLLVLAGVGLAFIGHFFKDWINQQFDQFPWALFWLTVGFIFMTALGVAVVTMPRATDAEPVDLTERKAIKGLRPFRREDAEIFSRLQRNRSLRDCLEALLSSTFRFGILMGESGCGKTSFLQAGLWPTLSQPDTSHYGVYVRFSDKEPIETVRQALIEQLELPEVAQDLNFLDLLSAAVDRVDKPLILLFDQFEQFFVHSKRKADRAPFIDSLKAWYDQSDLPVKILVCIRGDLCDRLIELHQTLGYALGPREVFRLEKLSPEEATEVLAVIAETEELPFDKRFITELSQQELTSREDGLILPVDLQVLAWTVNYQNMSELRAFNRLAFQKIGGIEGLLTRFLERTLDGRVTTTQRQAAVKVLLALTDLDRQVRAGVLTVAALQTKLKDTLQPEAVAEATTWLARPDVRLITPVNSGETGGYELSHERLIPALMRLAGKELSEADRVNQLLDRRVNEWLGNQRSRRYLFNWRELRLIEQHKPYLIWGTKRRQKERLIAQSQRSVYSRLTAFLAILLSMLLGWLWLSSPTGIIWQTRRELVQLSGKVPDSTAVEAATALAKDGRFNLALKICEQDIQSSSHKARALSAIVEIIGQLDDNGEAAKLLSQVLAVAEKIDDSYYKGEALGDIVEIIGQLDDNGEAEKLLSQVLAVAEKIDHSFSKSKALSAIAEAYGQLGDNGEAVKLLSQILAVAEKTDNSSFKAWALTVIAEAYSELDDNTEAEKLLSQVLAVAQKIDDSDDKARTLIAIAEAYVQLGDNGEAVKLLSQALTVAEKIDRLYFKASRLTAIAEVYVQLGNNVEAVKLLSQAVAVAEKIDDLSSKAWALNAIVEAYVQLGDNGEAVKLLSQVLTVAGNISNPLKATVLSAIVQITSQLGDNGEAVKPLSQALTVAEKIDDLSDKALMLTVITKAIGQLDDNTEGEKLLSQVFAEAQKIDDFSEQAWALSTINVALAKLSQINERTQHLKQALIEAQKIDTSNYKAAALSNIAETQAQFGNWRKAHHTVGFCTSNDCRVRSRAKLLTVWAQQSSVES